MLNLLSKLRKSGQLLSSSLIFLLQFHSFFVLFFFTRLLCQTDSQIFNCFLTPVNSYFYFKVKWWCQGPALPGPLFMFIWFCFAFPLEGAGNPTGDGSSRRPRGSYVCYIFWSITSCKVTFSLSFLPEVATSHRKGSIFPFLWAAVSVPLSCPTCSWVVFVFPSTSVKAPFVTFGWMVIWATCD